MKKIQDQLSALVSAPPRSTPAAPPLPEAAPQIPSATLRSRPSLNVVVRIDSAAGASNAAPRPCAPRKTINDADEEDGVGRDHPLQAVLAEVEVVLDRR